MRPNVPFSSDPPVWDLFCAVVDNFGDVGVCWRLARMLAAEHGLRPRLWIDAPEAARRLIPALDPVRETQCIEGVEIRRWREPLPALEPGEVVIGAFACTLPDAFLEAMAAREPRPCFVNLEYLSAEDWVAGCHGLPSPHPRFPLAQHFFFPGFAAGTGGLLRERDYEARRAAFDPLAWSAEAGLPPPRADELRVSLFGYETPALGELLEVWRDGPERIVCLVPEGRMLAPLAAWLGRPALSPGERHGRGALEIHVLPFVEQARFDALLWACDLNFVRGEDSFVRAQWAEKPFVWHIYRQSEDAHLEKLDAFLARYAAGLPPDAAMAVADFWRAWNLGERVAAAWPAMRAQLPALRDAGPRWADAIRPPGELARNLALFCKPELK